MPQGKSKGHSQNMPPGHSRRNRRSSDTDSEKKEGGSFEVCQSGAVTFHHAGQCRKAIESYSKV